MHCSVALAIAWGGALACTTSDTNRVSAAKEVSSLTMRAFNREPLHQIRAVAERSDGQVFALVSVPPFVYEFGPDGEPVPRPAIPRGNGPGDLANPWQLLRNPTGDTVFVVDVGNRKLLPITDSLHQAVAVPLRLPLQGMIRGSVRHVAFGDPLRIAWLLGRLIVAEYPGGVTEQSDYAVGRLNEYNTESDSSALLIDFRTLASAADQTLPSRLSLAPSPLWTACDDGRVLVFDPYARELKTVVQAGQAPRSVPMPDVPRSLTRRHVELFVRDQILRETNGRLPAADVKRAVVESMNALNGRFSDVAPDVVELACDASGRAWLQRFALEEHPLGYGAEWYTTDSALRTIARVRFPERFRPYSFGRVGVLGVYRDDEDVEYVAIVNGPQLQVLDTDAAARASSALITLHSGAYHVTYCSQSDLRELRPRSYGPWRRNDSEYSLGCRMAGLLRNQHRG